MENTKLQKQKRRFIEKELCRLLNDVDNPTKEGIKRIQDKILSSSIWGALMTRRGKRVYKQNITENEKNILKNGLKEELLKIELDKYADSNLTDWIMDRAERISNCFGNLLDNARFRVGISQKLTNLYLKYLWCLDPLSKSPPHCPFDGRVITYLQNNLDNSELKNKIKNIRWTKMDSMGDYQNLIEAARIVSKNERYQTVAEWELYLWNNDNEST